MKLFFAPMMIGMFALTGALPVAAQSAPDKGTSVGVSTSHDPAVERDSFKKQAQDEVRVWEKKLQVFEAKMQTRATETKTSASKDLDDAWAQTKTAFAALETASEKDWDSAKVSFKTASDKLATEWKKLNPT